MLALLLAANLASAAPGELLDAYRAAAGLGGAGAVTERYAYSGQGLEGESVSTYDRAAGCYAQHYVIGPTRGGSGFDGKLAWMQDLSGAYTRQDGGDLRALAVNQAYRKANTWWRADRGGARVESLGPDRLRITPVGGIAFEASFDPATHLLASVREPRQFQTVEIRYADHQRREGQLVATRLTIETDDNPATQEVYRLTDLSVAPAAGCTAFAMPATPPPNTLPPPGGRAELPIRILNNHIFVDVKVNGRGPFPFMVDTGGYNILTPSTIKALDLAAQGEGQSSGGGEKTTALGYTRVKSLDVGGAVMTDQTVISLDFSPTDVEGLEVGGMLGLEFFRRFVVEIDYGARTMTIVAPKAWLEADRRAAGVAVPFRFYGHMPEVAGDFAGRPARFKLDTGSRSDVSMTSPYVARERLRERYLDGVEVTEGWGVGGPTRAYVVRPPSLRLGPMTVPRPIAALSLGAKGAFFDPNYDGNVGSGLLKRFTTTFDYETATLYLKPTEAPDADTGEFDKVGLWLNLAPDGRAMQVMDVAPGGPAAAAGLKVGDLVLATGGRLVAGRALSDVRRDLKLAKIGFPFPIQFSRAGTVTMVSAIPRNLIP